MPVSDREETAMTIEKMRANLELLNEEDDDQDQQEQSTNESNNKFDCLKSTMSIGENELSASGLLIQQQQHRQQQQKQLQLEYQHLQQNKKQMEQYLLENYSASDEMPRQNSPGFFFS